MTVHPPGCTLQAVTTIYAGAVAPESLTMIITSDPDGVDLTSVSAAVIRVKKAGASYSDWGAAVIARDVHEITIRHVLEAGDTSASGDYVAMAILTVPDGTVRSDPQPFKIEDPLP